MLRGILCNFLFLKWTVTDLQSVLRVFYLSQVGSALGLHADISWENYIGNLGCILSVYASDIQTYFKYSRLWWPELFNSINLNCREAKWSPGVINFGLEVPPPPNVGKHPGALWLTGYQTKDHFQKKRAPCWVQNKVCLVVCSNDPQTFLCQNMKYGNSVISLS